MPTTSEEQALRTALSDAVSGQPAAPYDRIDGVRRRHVRRRQRQLVALGTAAVVAVTGAAFAVLNMRTSDSVQFAKRSVPSWALQWPDRRDPSIPQRVLDGAVDVWSREATADGSVNPADGATATALQVIWYRAAKVANGSEIVVMFEVESEYGQQLVIGHADTSQVIHGQPAYDVKNAETPWILYVVNAPAPSRHLVYGLNVQDSQSPQPNDTFAGNVVVVMADPRARSFDWHVTGADHQVRRATSTLTAGFGEFDTGQIRDRVRIDAVRDGVGKILARNVGVGVPGAAQSYQVQLAEVPAFSDAPQTTVGFGEFAGQGQQHDESQLDSPWPQHGTTIYARCYGSAHIVIAIDADRPGHRVVIPCDDREHVLSGPPIMTHSELASDGTEDANGNFVPNPRGTQNHAIEINASDETAWRVAVIVR